MLPHSAIYIEYIAALLIFTVQLVDICNIFSCLCLNLRIYMRSIIGNIHATNTGIGSHINIAGRNVFFRIEMSRQRRSVRYTVKVNTTVYIVRNGASYINSITKRIERTGSLSRI